MYRKQISMLLLAATIMHQVIAPAAVSASPATVTTGTVSKEDAEDKTQAMSISAFSLYQNAQIEAYNKEFRMDAGNIATIRQNGGTYASSTIDKAIDGDFKTHWETGTPNSEKFTNEVVFTFEEEQTINRLVYAARQDSAKGKGFATNVELYASSEDEGEFKLVGSASYTSTGEIVELRFAPTKMKQVKFVYKAANQEWASASEFQFYKEDALSDQVEDLFTDKAYMEVKEEYASKEKIEALMEQAKTHPLKEELEKWLTLAMDLVNDAVELEGRVIKAEQQGDRVSHAQKNLKFGFGNNNQPTGITAVAGETITVYVEAEEGKPLPQLVFSQQEGSFANWSKTVQLKRGKNVITAPTIATDKWYKFTVTKGGPLYIYNPYTEEQQGSAPVIRFEGGVRHPYLTEETDTEEFIEYLTEYKKKLDDDAAKNPNVEDRKVIDTFEFVTKHIVFTGTASGAYEAYVKKGINPEDTLASYTTYMENIFDFYGLDGSSENQDPKDIRENVRLAQPFGALYAAYSHIGIQRSHVVSFLTPFEQAGGNWGLTHEIGHRMDVYARLYGESTNNMLAMYTSLKYNTIDYRIPYETHIYKNVVSDNPPDFAGQGYFERIGAFWQLEMYQEGYWGKLNAMYRERNPVLDASNVEESRYQYLVEYSSEVLQLDLSEYFTRHGFTVTEETKKKVSVYDKPEDKIWYLNTKAVTYKGEGFSKDAAVSIEKKVDQAAGKVTLTFSMDDKNADDVMGYEIFKDGKLVAFTGNATYTDADVNLYENAKYEVVAYAYDLSTTKKAVTNSFEPSILADEKITLGLNSKFEPLSYASAFDHLGNEIEEITTSHDVDTSKKGTYEVTYTASSNGYERQVTSKVEVVSGYDSLSDYAWESATTAWGMPRKNTNLKLLVNNKVREFEKGLGIHANGEFIFDVSDLSYDAFEAFVGVDQSIAKQNNSSIIFRFYADGKEVFNSGLMKHDTNAKFVSIDLEGVKQLKLTVSDSGNGNTSDHAVIAATRLTTNNKKPVLTVKDKQYKIGENVDFLEGVTAIDAEDGTLTDEIEIISNTYEEDKVGRFKVTYRVTDSDKNSVEKSAYVTVYEEFTVTKSLYGTFDNLEAYNKAFKNTVASISNNGRNYGASVIGYAIDGSVATHWETGIKNSSTFHNEVIATFAELTEIDRIGYAARPGGKGFAQKFKIYVSTEESGDDFIYAGTGSYSGNVNDKIVIDITKTYARRVKFEFVTAYNSWASIGELSFYKEDKMADLLSNNLFTDASKTEVSSEYDSLKKLQALKDLTASYEGVSAFKADFEKAEQLIRAKFPTLTIPKSSSVKVGMPYDLAGTYQAQDPEDGDLTDKVVVSGEVNPDKPGTYEITYSVTDSDDNTVTKKRTITVADMDDSSYLSDKDFKSVSYSYTAPLKDMSVSKNALRLTAEDGSEVSYKKGIGAHATSTIIYDITDKDYAYFTSYVGVDRRMYGTVGSVEFKVYVDGTLAYESGAMTSRQPQKYIEVAIGGASELKLMVTDAGNGIGSDHATFGDAKLHFANPDNKGIDRTELNSLIEQAEELEEDDYTAESLQPVKEALEDVIAGMKDGYDQKEVDSYASMLKTAMDGLELAIDLSAQVKIPDACLKRAVKNALGLTTDTITVKDMRSLTSLEAAGNSITNISGLEYAKNLECLNLDWNEITDLSALKDLKKLKSVSINGQYVAVGMAKVEDGAVKIKETIRDSKGEQMSPVKVALGSMKGSCELSMEERYESGILTIEESELYEGLNSILVSYEDEKGTYSVHTLYMLDR